MDRRSFLRHAVVSSLGGVSMFADPLRLSFRSARADGLPARTLVVIFQRGGCDGHNTVVPYGDDAYYAARGDSIAIPAPGSGSAREALDLDGFFAFHPSMQPLHDLYVAGRVAVLPTVHFATATGSHFENQTILESGAETALADGWLNRYLGATAGAGPIRGITMGTGIAQSLMGEAKVTALSNLAEVGYRVPAEVEGSDLARWIEGAYAFEPGMDTSANLARLLDQGRVMLEDVELLGDIDVEGYVPENGAVYPDSDFGTQLRSIAQLIKEGAGLEVAALDLGNWDFHEAEGGAEPEGNQSQALEHFTSGIGALSRDLQARLDDVMILTMTEFGRTLHVNGGNGTDHGRAGSWFVIGGGARSGVYGEWPGLAGDRLIDGRYLAYTVDYRDVFGEILRRHLRVADLATILPGHRYRPLGFIS
jgi:uncharacterized protein (DUF1501 family)